MTPGLGSGAANCRLAHIPMYGEAVREGRVSSRDQALHELRRRLTELEFDYTTVLEIVDGGSSGFLARVRDSGQLTVHTLVLEVDPDGLGHDTGWSEPLPQDEVEAWVTVVTELLREELDTGVLQRGKRVTLEDGTVAIDPSLGVHPPSR
jgi:hypothetical protein